MRNSRGRPLNPPAAFIHPCQPIVAKQAPTGPGWAHELKHDGYRLQIHVRDGRVRLYTMTGADWSKRYPLIVEAAASGNASHRWYILRPMTPSLFSYRHAKAVARIIGTKDDYDVRLGDGSGPVVGRIMRHPQASETQPWFWTITAREQPPSVYNRGYAASGEQAMRYFKARWSANMN
jgi:hypothetical protein